MSAMADADNRCTAESGVKVKTGNAPRRSDARLDPQIVQGDRPTGRWNFSASRPATMPITPGCQPRPASTSAGCAPRSNCSCGLFMGGQIDAPLQAFAAAVQFVQIVGQGLTAFGRSGGQQFDAQHAPGPVAGGVQPRRERKGDVLARKRASRPIRQLEQQPRSPSQGDCQDSPTHAARKSDSRSTSGTMSATVPSATSPTAFSRKFRIGVADFFGWLARWQSAQATLNATPAPHSPTNG